MKNIWIAGVLFSISAFGAVKLQLQVEYAGEKVSPMVIAQSGEPVTITQNDLRIEVTPKVQQEIATLSFQLFRDMDLIASPTVVTRLGSPAEINSTDAQGETVRLKVTATEIR